MPKSIVSSLPVARPVCAGDDSCRKDTRGVRRDGRKEALRHRSTLALQVRARAPEGSDSMNRGGSERLVSE